MPSLCFLVTTVVIFSISPCEGVITAPRDMTEYTFLPGRTVNITWVFNDTLSTVLTRSWSLTSDTGPGGSLAEIYRENKPNIRTKLYDVDVIEPATLVLKNVNQSYNAIYRFSLTVDVSSVVVTRSRSVSVFIAKKPNLSLNCPRLVEMVNGENIACQCKGEGGNPPANVTWFKDGVKFTDVGTEKQTLNISIVDKTDKGIYKCVARSYPHKNYTDEKSIEVTVYTKPNVTINCSSLVTVKEGNYVTCECNCKDGDPPANCSWNKNGKEIVTKRKELSRLTFQNVSRKDKGNYTCVGESHVVAQNKKSIQVLVKFKPTNVSVTLSTYPAMIDEPVTIMCTFQGFPEPSYNISHNDTNIVSTNKPYNISRVKWEDAGTYTCIAINNLGIDNHSVILKVEKKPLIKPTPTRTMPSSSTSGGKGHDGKKDKPNIGLIVGIAVGVGVPFIVIVCCALFYFKDTLSCCCGESSCRCGESSCCCGESSCRCGESSCCAALSCCCGDDKRGNADVNPNGSRVIRNHYELEEDHGEDAGAYDTVKQSDDGEGSQDKKKPAGDSLPPVYASVNKENRQGNTLYASLDSEALRKPGSKKKQPETKNAPTEYASIDFMQTGKTPNADNA